MWVKKWSLFQTFKELQKYKQNLINNLIKLIIIKTRYFPIYIRPKPFTNECRQKHDQTNIPVKQKDVHRRRSVIPYLFPRPFKHIDTNKHRGHNRRHSWWATIIIQQLSTPSCLEVIWGVETLAPENNVGDGWLHF